MYPQIASPMTSESDEMDPQMGYNLRLISSVDDEHAIPVAGKRLVVVARAGQVLHFRIFDVEGAITMNTDSRKLTDQGPAIDELRTQLDGLWPPHEISETERAEVIGKVSSVVSQAPQPDPEDEHAGRERMLQEFGEQVCRQLGIYRIPDDLTLSVVIPVYKELRTIHEIVRQVRAVPIRKQIILVDDCSTDGTRELLQEWARTQPDLTIAFHDKNHGKGAALRTGFSLATGQIVIVQDADLEYDPAQYPQLIQPIVEGKADVVYGSRFIGESHRVHFFWHMLANKFLTLLSNMFTNLNLTDMEVCYKVFRLEVIQGIKLSSNRFGFEPEVTAKVARVHLPAKDGRPARKCRIYEIPVSYNGRDYKEGKHITWKDGVQALYCIVRYWWKD